MNIYYINKNYPEKRCVIERALGENYVSIAAAGNVCSLKSAVEKIQHAFAHRYSKYLGEKTLSCYWLMKRKGVVHTFNSCISGKNEWCATFETILPRTNYTRSGMKDPNGVDKTTKQHFKLLAKENCLGCMALSKATYELQMAALDKMKEHLTKQEIASIRKKTRVLHPPQELMITQEDIVHKFENCDTLEWIFVGHDFFRKGGKELMDCLMDYKGQIPKDCALYQRGCQKLHLTVISSMEYGDYASKATREEMLRYKELLKKEGWITYYESLPNGQVMELCKKAHIGLLPTFADTYGYSVLEMQACGCAMLTTDIRALPEINNETCGWICHLPQNEYKEAYYRTEEERIVLKRTLFEQLQKQMEIILGDSIETLQQKALCSWERIRRQHDPVEYSEVLKRVFIGK